MGSVVPLFDPLATAELTRLWEDFRDKRERAFASVSIDDAIAAGKAYGALLAAIAHADDRDVAALKDGVHQT